MRRRRPLTTAPRGLCWSWHSLGTAGIWSDGINTGAGGHWWVLQAWAAEGQDPVCLPGSATGSLRAGKTILPCKAVSPYPAAVGQRGPRRSQPQQGGRGELPALCRARQLNSCEQKVLNFFCMSLFMGMFYLFPYSLGNCPVGRKRRWLSCVFFFPICF